MRFFFVLTVHPSTHLLAFRIISMNWHFQTAVKPDIFCLVLFCVCVLCCQGLLQVCRWKLEQLYLNCFFFFCKVISHIPDVARKELHFFKKYIWKYVLKINRVTGSPRRKACYDFIWIVQLQLPNVSIKIASSEQLPYQRKALVENNYC